MKNLTLFKKWMAAYGEQCGKLLTEINTNIIWRILEPYTDEQCLKAFEHVFKTSKFISFPKPYEFLEALGASLEEQALVAWSKVAYAVSHVGPYASIQFDDTIIHSCIDAMGGWIKLQDPKTWSDTWTQKEFIKWYGIKAKNDDHPWHCAGISEQDNASFPEFIKPPIRIETGIRGKIKMIEPPTPKIKRLPENAKNNRSGAKRLDMGS